jgi:NMD protein affecting ribosome stability and mRNA decay
MANYYIRRPDNSNQSRLIQSLIDAYSLTWYPVIEIVTNDPLLAPILTSLSAYTIKGEESKIPEAHAQPKKLKRETKVDLCPECGRMAQMTKKGYCKLCAMGKAREAKKNGKKLLESIPVKGRGIELEVKPAVILESEDNPAHFMTREVRSKRTS